MHALKLAIASLLNRKLSTSLTICSLALSVALLFGIERLRQGARESFANTISQTDLIVGAKGGTIQLLLYAVFRIGSATDNISYQTYEEISRKPDVAWTIPYSLGDSHRGFRVVGTTGDFYDHYRYRRKEALSFQTGERAKKLFDVVLGAEVADRLNYKTGDRLTLSHGVSEVAFQNHENKPFTVVGILKRTATPIDRSLYVSLEAIEAIHMDWDDGAPPLPEHEISGAQLEAQTIKVKQITAFLLGAKSRLDTLQMQRDINDYEDEALMAIIPGVALSELWEGISYAEAALQAVSFFVVLVGLLGMLITIYNSLNERRREMAILRALGAGPLTIFGLMVIESTFLCVAGCVIGIICSYVFLFAGQGVIERHFGLYIPIEMLQAQEWVFLFGVIALGFVMGLLPAWRAYRNTLQDGLMIKV